MSPHVYARAEVDRILYDDFMSFIRHRVRKDHA